MTDRTAATSHLAGNYAPLPVDIVAGRGAWLWDANDRRYLDCLAGYSAMNFGHGEPSIVQAASDQLRRLTLTGRAFGTSILEEFITSLCAYVGFEMAVPMNTGAEAVETAIKLARLWGSTVRRVAEQDARIVVMDGNFHGRTTTIVGFSTDALSRSGFGPFGAGFSSVPFGDVESLRACVDEHTIAVLIEPIQGEAGVILPPDGYLAEIRRVCDQVGALLIADEVQSGLGRAGTTLACEHWGVQPDLVILGKALGGGVLPLSAVLGPRSVLGLLRPGQHGSTFGGNPLACAIGMTVVDQLRSGRWHERAQRIGAVIETGLGALPASCVRESRCVGAWAGIDIPPELAHGRDICLSMARRGILMKETHDQTLRISPTLAATTDEIAAVFEELGDVLECYAAAG